MYYRADKADEDPDLFMWYSPSHGAWVLNEFIGHVTYEPLMYSVTYYSEFFDPNVASASWNFICEDVHSYGIINMCKYTLFSFHIWLYHMG